MTIYANQDTGEPPCDCTHNPADHGNYHYPGCRLGDWIWSGRAALEGKDPERARCPGAGKAPRARTQNGSEAECSWCGQMVTFSLARDWIRRGRRSQLISVEHTR